MFAKSFIDYIPLVCFIFIQLEVISCRPLTSLTGLNRYFHDSAGDCDLGKYASPSWRNLAQKSLFLFSIPRGYSQRISLRQPPTIPALLQYRLTLFKYIHL